MTTRVAGVNYLHYGDALSKLWSVEAHLPKERIAKKALLSTGLDDRSSSCYLRDIVEFYGSRRSKKVDLTKLVADAESSRSFRKFFQSLGCRGFSYDFCSGMQGFPHRLKRRIDLRLALVPSPSLFYPDRVRGYFWRATQRHYFVNGRPAIGFALGRSVGRKWFILVLQSDIAYSRLAYVRDHFRGWRKILFANIIKAAAHMAEEIYLCTAEDVYRAAWPRVLRPEAIPGSWKSIYDGTARFFGMRKVKMSLPVDIQIYAKAEPVYCQRFYRLKLSGAGIKKIPLPPEDVEEK
jgi:hypothetical protein